MAALPFHRWEHRGPHSGSHLFQIMIQVAIRHHNISEFSGVERRIFLARGTSSIHAPSHPLRYDPRPSRQPVVNCSSACHHSPLRGMRTGAPYGINLLWTVACWVGRRRPRSHHPSSPSSSAQSPAHLQGPVSHPPTHLCQGCCPVRRARPHSFIQEH